MEELKLRQQMTGAEKAMNDQLVVGLNRQLNEGKGLRQNMEMGDFLKILTTQLSHQDPSAPMEDKEFISQMAQISSLDRMNAMAENMARLTAILGGSEASSALGRQVEITDGDRVVQGTVKAVSREAEPSVMVNGQYYAWKQVTKVFE